MNTASIQWEHYRKHVYKEPLGRIQERDCSMAFYAGMHAPFLTMSELANATDDIDSGAAMAETFNQDIRQAAVEANLDRSDGLS